MRHCMRCDRLEEAGVCRQPLDKGAPSLLLLGFPLHYQLLTLLPALSLIALHLNVTLVHVQPVAHSDTPNGQHTTQRFHPSEAADALILRLTLTCSTANIGGGLPVGDAGSDETVVDDWKRVRLVVDSVGRGWRAYTGGRVVTGAARRSQIGRKRTSCCVQ